jgi:type I restriction enzyme, S subunit
MPTKNKTQKLVPELRFPEFRGAGEWDEKPLSACLDYKQPTPYLVSDSNYSPAFKTPVLTAGKTFILGYTDEEHGIFSEDLPVIIFDDFTTATQFVDFPFKAKSSAMKILQAKDGVNIKFMFEALQMLSYEVGAHERHWISTFAPTLFLIPTLPEQQKIADCLGSLDELLAAHRRKLAALQDHKKGLLQQLFPAEGETTPNLRFPGFEGEWDPLSVEELLKGLPTRDHQILSSEIKEMGKYPVVDQGQSAIAGYSDRSEKLFHKHPVIVFGDHTTVVKFIDFDFIVGADGTKLLTKRRKPDSLQFLSFALANYKMAQEGYKRHFTILRQIVIPIPSPPEQQKIADCLSALDALITAQTDQIAALHAHKKGLMQQLFPNPQGVA